MAAQDDSTADAIAAIINIADQENASDSTYLLELGAHLPIVNHKLRHEKRLTEPVNIVTAANPTLQTMTKGTLKIRTKAKTLTLPALRNNQISANLLSVKSLASRYGR